MSDTTAPASFVPKWATTTAAALAPLLLALSPFLPTVGGVALSTCAAILAFICAGLAGLGLPQVTFGSHSPLVPLTIVPFLASAVPIVVQLAAATGGVLSVVLQGAALVLCFLAGLASPPPKVAVMSDTKAKDAVVTELSK